jgi:hypothetical protein
MESAWACLEEHRCAWRSLETSRKGFRKTCLSLPYGTLGKGPTKRIYRTRQRDHSEIGIIISQCFIRVWWRDSMAGG